MRNRLRSLSTSLGFLLPGCLLLVCFLVLCLAGCRSRGIDLAIENHAPAAIRNVEVDYPGAAFGIGRLGPGDSYPYRIKPLRAGELTLSFEEAEGRSIKLKGPAVGAGESGKITITLELDSRSRWQIRSERR